MQYAHHVRIPAHVKSPSLYCHQRNIQVAANHHPSRSLQSRKVSYHQSSPANRKQNEPTILLHFVPPDSPEARFHFEAIQASRNQWAKEIEEAERARVTQSLKRGIVTIKSLEQKIDVIDEIISDLSNCEAVSEDVKQLNEGKETVEKTLEQLANRLNKMQISLRH